MLGLLLVSPQHGVRWFDGLEQVAVMLVSCVRTAAAACNGSSEGSLQSWPYKAVVRSKLPSLSWSMVQRTIAGHSRGPLQELRRRPEGHPAVQPGGPGWQAHGPQDPGLGAAKKVRGSMHDIALSGHDTHTQRMRVTLAQQMQVC